MFSPYSFLTNEIIKLDTAFHAQCYDNAFLSNAFSVFSSIYHYYLYFICIFSIIIYTFLTYMLTHECSLGYLNFTYILYICIGEFEHTKHDILRYMFLLIHLITQCIR